MTKLEKLQQQLENVKENIRGIRIADPTTTLQTNETWKALLREQKRIEKQIEKEQNGLQKTKRPLKKDDGKLRLW